MNTNVILNLAQAHAYLGVSEKTLRNYCKARKISFHHEKNDRGVMEYRFRRQDLDDLLERRKSFGSAAKSRVKLEENANVGMQRKIAMDGKSSMARMPEDDFRSVILCQEKLLQQLQTENIFLKELLIEKEKQIAAKDRNIERHLERVSTLNESLAALANSMLARKPE